MVWGAKNTPQVIGREIYINRKKLKGYEERVGEAWRFFLSTV